MAQPTNTFDTYDAVGIREDLADVIYNVDPSETPFTASLLKQKQRTLLSSGKHKRCAHLR